MSAYVQLMRPHQWIKNLVVLAGPAFALKFFEIEAFATMAAFCLAASASYAINDLMDREADRAHPEKRHRPIASGRIKPVSAVVFAVFLAAAAIGITLLPIITPTVTWIVALYLVLILAYSLFLKRRPILDVIVIAVGFVLRAVAGAAAVNVDVSPWLIVCTFTLCLFLGFGKRRCELATLENKADAAAHRSTLLRYTPELLNHLTSVSVGIAMMTFLLYTMDANPARHPPFAKEYLLYTLPLVAYALFRYAMLIETGKFTGPMQIVLKDRAVVVTGLLWVIAVGAIIVTTRNAPVAAPAASQPVPIRTSATG